VRRRVVAALVAVLLAGVGGVLLLSYVGAADQRAMADLEPVAVLVATQSIPEGASADGLADAVQVRLLPGVAVNPGTAADLAALRGLVTTTALQPGEQLLLSRFADPAVLEAAKGVVVPEGLQQVSVQLEPERAVNGTLTAGATVGVFLSTKDEDTTQLALHRVLVTAVQGGASASSDSSARAEGEDAAATSAEGVTITLALDAESASRVVFAAEHGSIWLSAEPAEAATTDVPVTTEKSLYS
jgi:pilus assembly protein CpaB